MPQTWIALLAAIGPATHKVMLMADLRAACQKAGFTQVQTVLATGNVIFQSDLPEARIGKTLADIVADHGLDNRVFLRRPKDLRTIRDANPFAEAGRERPSHLLIHFMGRNADTDALAGYDGPERIAVMGREVFIDYVDGVGTSKLTGARLLRALGQPGTARNWNTLGKLIDKS